MKTRVSNLGGGARPASSDVKPPLAITELANHLLSICDGVSTIVIVHLVALFSFIYLVGAFLTCTKPMEEAHTALRAPQYASEDTTPTTTRELRGWYSYGMAAEIFAVCGVGMFRRPSHLNIR